MRTAAAVLALLAVAGCGAPAGPADAGSDPLRLRVLAIHDFHGALRPATAAGSAGSPVGGAAALKNLMDRLEAACGCVTVRLDGGDQMQGTLESNLVEGASVVAAMNHLGLDAAAVGNHELDWGVETLLDRQREARYAWLAANVFQAGTDDRPEWARPWALVERDSVRVGVVGYATVNTPRTLRPATTAGYEFRAGYAGIREALDAVWLERPDFVVLVAHADGDCTAGGCTGEMVALAEDLPSGTVHLIVGGHTHAPGEGVVNDIPIVRAGGNGRAVAVVDLDRASDGSHAFTVAFEPVFVDAEGEDPTMLDLLEPYAAAADAIGRTPVTTLAETLTASPAGDRRLGFLIAEAARRVAGADVGLHNPGGVRADLLQGVVSYAALHRVMPFDNTVVRLSMTGRELRALVEQAGVRYYFSNLRIEHDPRAVPGSRIVSLALEDGLPIRDGEIYTLATSDFLADGGDGLAMLPPLPRDPLGITLLDAMVEYLRELPAPVVPSVPVHVREVEAAAR